MGHLASFHRMLSKASAFPPVSGPGYPWAKVITRALTPWAAKHPKYLKVQIHVVLLIDKVNFVILIIHKVDHINLIEFINDRDRFLIGPEQTKVM